MNEGDKQKVVDSVAAAAREGLGRMSAEQLEVGWERLERALSSERPPSVRLLVSPSRTWLRGLGFAMAAAAVVVLAYRFAVMPGRDGGLGLAEAPLHYVLEGATVGPGEVIAAGATPARLVFSDSSDVAMAPAAVVSVLSLDSHGSRIALSKGALEVRVHHRSGTSWRFDAGPFTVRVRGTEFHLAYEAGKLTVQMHTGVVEVQAPNRTISLRGGESLELFAQPVSPPEARPASSVPAKETGEPTEAAHQVPAEAAPPRREPATHASSPHRRAGKPEEGAAIPEDAAEGWGKLIARGDFTAVVKDAERRGVDATLAGASAADLSHLADAARYTRRSDLARQALLGLRARFPGSTAAKDAAFFLGRLAEQPPSAQPQASTAALAWYETYLRESVGGPFAGEALGREIAIWMLSDRARAREAARTYLERFPHGTQAELAKSLVQSPP